MTYPWHVLPMLCLGLTKEQYLIQPLAKGGFGHFPLASEALSVLALRFRSVGSHSALARVPQLCLGLWWLWADACSSLCPGRDSSIPVGLLFSFLWHSEWLSCG